MYDTRDDPMSDVPLPADWYESHVMGAADPLWQWDVHSDRIVLSPEAANLLQGGAGNGYRGECGAFCDGLADDRQESVRQLFGSLRRSSFDSAMEILQTVGEDIICCRAIVLERFSCGTPRLLVGALTRIYAGQELCPAALPSRQRRPASAPSDHPGHAGGRSRTLFLQPLFPAPERP